MGWVPPKNPRARKAARTRQRNIRADNAALVEEMNQAYLAKMNAANEEHAKAARAAHPPEHEKFAALASSHHEQAQATTGRAAMVHQQLAALYADAAHASSYLLHTKPMRGHTSNDGADRAAMRTRLATLKAEIADVRKGLT